jgi:hypothetical protein
VGKAAQVEAGTAQLMGDMLTGTAAETMVKKAEAVFGVTVESAALKKAPEVAAAALAHQVKPAAGVAAVEALGQGAQAEVKQLATATGSDAALKKAARESLDASTHLATRGRQLLAATAEESTVEVITAALAKLEAQGSRGAAAYLDAIWRRVSVRGDTEKIVAAIAKEARASKAVSSAQVDSFVRAVHDQLCDSMVTQLELLLKQTELVTQVRTALDVLRKSGHAPEIAPVFRDQVRALVADQGGVLLERVVARLIDPVVQRQFLESLFRTMCEKYAGAMIAGHFDAAGMRRILGALYSFRKSYTPQSRLKAMENLIGWMYEATRFTSKALEEEASTVGAQLSTLLQTQFKSLGLSSTGKVLVHYNVSAMGKTGLRQATDVMATVPITLGEGAGARTVHVVLAALEAKGERGVLSGIRQVIEKLLTRFSKDSPVVNFTVGHELFLSIEDAARSLKVNPTKARELAAAVRPGLDRYRAFVVSPLPEKVALATYKANFGPAAKATEKITYQQHPIPRSTMVAIVQGLASVFGLGPPP